MYFFETNEVRRIIEKLSIRMEKTNGCLKYLDAKTTIAIGDVTSYNLINEYWTYPTIIVIDGKSAGMDTKYKLTEEELLKHDYKIVKCKEEMFRLYNMSVPLFKAIDYAPRRTAIIVDGEEDGALYSAVMNAKGKDGETCVFYGANNAMWCIQWTKLCGSIFEQIWESISTLTKPKIVGVAGTFNAFHDGHKALLDAAAKAGDLLVVAITVKPKKTVPVRLFDLRAKDVVEYITTKYPDKVVHIAPLDDTQNKIARTTRNLDVMVCSEETEKNTREIIEERKKNGFKTDIIVIPLIKKNGKKISSTDIIGGIL